MNTQNRGKINTDGKTGEESILFPLPGTMKRKSYCELQKNKLEVPLKFELSFKIVHIAGVQTSSGIKQEKFPEPGESKFVEIFLQCLSGL